MKKRILSIVCIVALLATVISVCAVYAFGADESALETEAFSFENSSFDITDWTVTNNSPSVTDAGMKLSAINDQNYATLTYKDKYDLSNGFTLEYAAKGKANTSNFDDDYIHNGVKIGEIIVGMNKFVTPVIDKNGTVVKQGTSLITGTEGADIRSWVTNTEPTADEIKYIVKFDAETDTVTYERYHGTTQVFSISYTDSALDFSDAEIALYHNNRGRCSTTYKSIKLTVAEESDGNGGGEEVAPPTALYGTGLVVSSINPAIPEEWTLSNAQCVADNSITLHANSGNSLNKATYNEPFILTDGFELTFNAYTAGTSNIAGQPGKNFLGAKVGNITAALRVVDTKDAIVMVIAVDGTVVATSEAIYDSTDPVWTRDTAARNIEYFFSNYYLGNSEFALSYDPATKTVTYSLIVGSTEEGTLTYVDDADAIDLSEAVLEFQSQGAWNAHATYKSIKLEGATCTQHVFDDENDTDCNNCGAVREIGGEPGDNIVRGEALTTWAPESFVADDWTGHNDKFVDGEFVIEQGNPTYTVWTVKNYDMSEGFTFKGTLKMKNGYNNYNNEWCSAYFGTEDENLELRIRNDDTTPTDADKDNTYTAYLLYKGEEIASSDLTVLPNGEYELTYVNGKVSVNLGGVAISWTPADGSAATTSVAVDAKETLYNAKLGLRLSGNWCPNGREWSVISIEKISKSGVHTGDSRNLVLPACVMLLSAVAVAVVLGKKKVMG